MKRLCTTAWFAAWFVLAGIVAHAETPKSPTPSPKVTPKKVETSAPKKVETNAPKTATPTPKRRPAPRKAAGAGSDQTNFVDTSQNKATDPYWDRPYLVAAYATVWSLFFIYLVVLLRRIRSNQDDLSRLEKRVEELVSEEG